MQYNVSVLDYNIIHTVYCSQNENTVYGLNIMHENGRYKCSVTLKFKYSTLNITHRSNAVDDDG